MQDAPPNRNHFNTRNRVTKNFLLNLDAKRSPNLSKDRQIFCLSSFWNKTKMMHEDGLLKSTFQKAFRKMTV